MAAFELRVFKTDGVGPIHAASCDGAGEVTPLITRLLGEHPGCERIDVRFNGGKLFSVDCKGSRLPD